MSVVSGQSLLLDIDELAVENDSNSSGALTDAFVSADLYFELGQWLAGLETFCFVGHSVYFRGRERANSERKYLAEFSICNAVLIRCAELIHSLRADKTTDPEFTRSTLAEVERFIPDALVLNTAIARSSESSVQEWNSWCNALADRLKRLKIVKECETEFVRAGEFALPDALQSLLRSESVSSDDRRDLRCYLPRLGGILKSLEIVRAMLDQDLPIRPAVVIFSHIYETIDSLVRDMNNRLAVHPDESSELFAMTDAASYTLSIDSRKIFGQELEPIFDVRSAINAYARVESAYSVLNDNIRQLLAGFAQLVEPTVTANEIFPQFHAKLEESIALRAKLWTILNSVRNAEAELTDETLGALRAELRLFLDEPASYLFYKDRETFERFCTEIELTSIAEDAAPIVHRFSAYVETLFSLVQMRSVLANHPMPTSE